MTRPDVCVSCRALQGRLAQMQGRLDVAQRVIVSQEAEMDRMKGRLAAFERLVAGLRQIEGLQIIERKEGQHGTRA